MLNYRRNWITIVFLCLFFLSAFVPQDVFASEAMCNCYCTSPTGAKSKPDATTKISLTDCRERCEEDGGQSIAAFACTANQHPSRSVNCFTSAQCTDVNGVLGDNYQPTECPNGYFYCYPDPSKAAKVTLSTSIAGLQISGDFGEYISQAYLWILAASTTIAIVFMMVAGLRWAIGGLSSEQVGKAQKMISNSIAGLVLLLCAYVIFATINPQLLRLKAPSLPLIKTVSLVDNASCDEFISEGYTVEFSGPKECGTVGTVTMDSGGNNVADGVVCNFSHCSDPRKICIPGDTPTCMLCEELTINNPVLPPSQSLCSAFNSLTSYDNDMAKKTSSYTPSSGPNAGKAITWEQEVYEKYEQCFFTHDPDAGAEATGRGACARVVISCNNISSCDGYNTVPVFIGSPTNSVPLQKIDFGINSGVEQSTLERLYTSAFGEFGEFTLGSVCGYGSVNDICAYNRTGEDNGKACEINTINLLAITDAVSFAAAYSCTYFDHNSWWVNLFN